MRLCASLGPTMGTAERRLCGRAQASAEPQPQQPCRKRHAIGLRSPRGRRRRESGAARHGALRGGRWWTGTTAQSRGEATHQFGIVGFASVARVVARSGAMEKRSDTVHLFLLRYSSCGMDSMG